MKITLSPGKSQEASHDGLNENILHYFVKITLSSGKSQEVSHDDLMTIIYIT